MNNKVYVLIVNYKSELFTANAIKSIAEEKIEVKILIVDNESTQESFSLLSTIDDKRIEVLPSEQNLGFAGGNNLGYKYLINKYNDVKYLFLLNPDAIATKNVIYNLLQVMSNYDNCAAVSPHIYDQQSKQDWFAGTMIDYSICKINNSPSLSNIESSEIDVFNGCSVLFDATTFQKAGMFNEDTFLYYDEAFLSKEIEKLGYSIYYSPKLEVFHDVSSTTGNYSYLKNYYMTRNHIHFFKLYSKKSFLCPYRVPIRNMISALKHLRLKAIRGITFGIIDSLIGKVGKK